MDNFPLRMFQTIRDGTNSRSPKTLTAKAGFSFGISNKENDFNASNTRSSWMKREEKETFITSQEREKKSQSAQFQIHDSSHFPFSQYSKNNTLYMSPKHAEIELMKENYETPNHLKYVNNFVPESTHKENKAYPSDNKEAPSGAKTRKEESSPHYKLNQGQASTRNSSTTTTNEDNVSEKITIYTRLLSSMKPLTPKTNQIVSIHQSFNSPKNTQQRLPMSLIASTNEAKKAYLNGPTINGRIDKVMSPSNRDNSSNAKNLRNSFKDNFKEEPVKAKERENETRQRERLSTQVNHKQETPSNKDRYLLSKKLTIDVHDNTETRGREFSTNDRNSSNDGRLSSRNRLHNTVSNFWKDTNNTNSSKEHNNFKDYSNNEYSSKDSTEKRVIVKPSIPKVMNPDPQQKRKMSSSLSNFYEKTSQNSIKKDPNNKDYHNYLKTSDVQTREMSLETNYKENHSSSTPKALEKENRSILVRIAEVQSSMNSRQEKSQPKLKDFVTQVSPGNNTPLKWEFEKKLTNSCDQEFFKKNLDSYSAKHAVQKRVTFDDSAQKLQTSQTTGSGQETKDPRRCSTYKQINEKRHKTQEDEPRYSHLSKSRLSQTDLLQNQIYYMTNLRKYILGVKSNKDDYFEKIFREHFLQTYQAVNYCKYLKPISHVELLKKKVNLPKKESHKDKRTLIFDLDETLIHCNENLDIPCDAILTIKFGQGDAVKAGINVRPYAIECLEELSKYYEIIVFTASHSCYANVALDYLDPEKKYIHHRLFRDHCVTTQEGLYIKDLRILANRDIKDIVIVDNAVYSFGYQLENGIPIIPFYTNKQDTELKSLISYLKAVYEADDVREINKKTFKLHCYAESESLDQLLIKIS